MTSDAPRSSSGPGGSSATRNSGRTGRREAYTPTRLSVDEHPNGTADRAGTRPPASPAKVEFQTPHPALRNWVSHYWLLSGHLDHSDARAIQPVPPYPNALFIFQLGDPTDVAFEDGVWHSRAEAFAEGHFRQPFLARFTGRFRMAAISFRPGQIHHMLRDSQSQINGRFVDLADILDGECASITGRLRTCRGIKQMAPVFDRLLLSLTQRCLPDPRGLSKTIDLAASRPHHVTVDDLARFAGVGKRQLERHFQSAVGLAPKYFCQVARFYKFLDALRHKPETPLTTLALDCGYFDQAHLINEFKRFTGLCPTAYLARDYWVEATLSGYQKDGPIEKAA